jgi:hypothetical protein
MLRCVVWWKFIDVSDVLAASITREPLKITGKLLPDHTALYHRRHSSFYLPSWEPEMSQKYLIVLKLRNKIWRHKRSQGEGCNLSLVHLNSDTQLYFMIHSAKQIIINMCFQATERARAHTDARTHTPVKGVRRGTFTFSLTDPPPPTVN